VSFAVSACPTTSAEACQAGWRPDDVDLIECHGTGTPLGDAVEIRSLRALWEGISARPGQCPIGSVKSMIGHLLTGAGAAGLIKLLLALRAGRLPPSLNWRRGGRVIPLEGSPFRVQTHAAEWEPRDTKTPRRAAISAFGFGGINAHVLIEQHWPGQPGVHNPQSQVRTPAVGRLKPESGSIAIVGLGCRFSAADDIAAFAALIGECPPVASAGSARFLHELKIPLGKYHIPPNELPELLPQQSLMLDVAAAALEDAGMPLRQDRPAMGALIGIGFDFRATDFHLRWWLEGKVDEWVARLGMELSAEARSSWLAELRGAIAPPLTPGRTLGALGSVVASRIAREFRLGGASFAVSADEVSGLRALEIAIRALQAGEMDAALVGAVDLACDPRNLACAESSGGSVPTGEGAAALVLKRMEDARRDGDRIYAVLRAASDADSAAITVECADPEVGNTGAVSGLAALLKAAICISDQIDPIRGSYWARNRADGPRRARVRAGAGDANEIVVTLEEPPPVRESTPLVPEPLVRESVLATSRRGNPLPRPLPAAIIALHGDTPTDLIRALEDLRAEAAQADSLSTLAVRRAAEGGSNPARRTIALVAKDHRELLNAIEYATHSLKAAPQRPLNGDDGVFFNPTPLVRTGELALVFPGSGNHFVGMGRELFRQWPDPLRRLDGGSLRFADQLGAELFWRPDQSDIADDPSLAARIRDDIPSCIFAQVTFGVAVSDLLRSFGVEPTAMIGYSLGESAALFAARAWPDRDEMYRRMEVSPLFRTDLAGPRDAVRRAWRIPADRPIDWRVVVVPRPADQVREALGEAPHARLLIVNTPGECVIGGLRAAVEDVVRRLRCRAIPIEAVPSVHCDVLRPVERAYRDLHLFDVSAPAGVRVYSAAAAAAYEVTRESAADSITDQAIRGFDFPAIIERAYAEGVRIFVETGPQNSCSRMIGRILGERSHLARSASVRGENEVLSVLRLLGALIAEGVPVDLARVYPAPEIAVTNHEPDKSISIRVRPGPFEPPLPRIEPLLKSSNAPGRSSHPEPFTGRASSRRGGQADRAPALALAMADARATVTAAHDAFLRFSASAGEGLASALRIQSDLLCRVAVSPEVGRAPPCATRSSPARPSAIRDPRTAIAYSRAQCLEFARGRVADVLGPEFAIIDSYATRVRLPDEPLMLVDRILSIEGAKRSLTSGRLVTEHDVLPGAWYLDGDRCPICITVEAGQADLFLSGYLGIDFVTRGERTYRLLDATVTFHRGLPRPGETIRYDIRIDRFVRQGETYLFFFEFDGTIDGRPVLTMRNGCAGFFTKQEIENSHGIVLTADETQPAVAKTPADFNWPVASLSDHFGIHHPRPAIAYSDSALSALRAGDLAGCFGAPFGRLALRNPLRLPGGRMKLIDRVLELDGHGGRYGLGYIRAEADIHPDDWFLTCHFVDDMVMPGTLMYECCVHTLRFFLLRMGWITEADGVAYEPIPGVHSSLRCRGPVTPASKKVHYELHIREAGYRPEPYVLADALMYADGKRIVRINNMSLQMTGLAQEKIEAVWKASHQRERLEALVAREAPTALQTGPSAIRPAHGVRRNGNAQSAIGHHPSSRGPRGFSREQILAFAIGNPSDCFGEPYRVFDRDRRIARLPGPPYQFLDRVTKIDHPPFDLSPTGWIEAEYDVPPDAWYFAANRQPTMPFAVLLEVALQPCGFLAAYCGSALTSATDLSFRNLGGTAVLHEEIYPDAGTIRTRVRMTDVSRAGGMIIQKFDMQVLRAERVIYEGDTSFGFFSKAALDQQVGIRDASSRLWKPSRAEVAAAKRPVLPDDSPYSPDDLPDPRPAMRHPPFPLPARAFRMIDRIDCLLPEGGPNGLGFIEGSINVDPAAWFFKAHFYQDPVWPGSLGLEAFLQLLKVFALDRWPEGAATHRFEPIALGQRHTWVYRGQVIPTNQRVEVQALITRRADGPQPLILASGFLSVDGIIIYEMSDFGIRMVDDECRMTKDE